MCLSRPSGILRLLLSDGLVLAFHKSLSCAPTSYRRTNTHSLKARLNWPCLRLGHDLYPSVQPDVVCQPEKQTTLALRLNDTAQSTSRLSNTRRELFRFRCRSVFHGVKLLLRRE